MQQNEKVSTSRGKRWELFHSLWIGWTFTLGFFSWLAFVYIGLRTRHTRWVLWALLYATPLILLLFFRPAPGNWQTNLILSATLALGVASIIHAFLIRKEYLLRLELLQRETSNVSVTSRGKRWEWLHSLWIAWTFVLGLFSWVAFIYIGLRVRRFRSVSRSADGPLCRLARRLVHTSGRKSSTVGPSTPRKVGDRRRSKRSPAG